MRTPDFEFSNFSMFWLERHLTHSPPPFSSDLWLHPTTRSSVHTLACSSPSSAPQPLASSRAAGVNLADAIHSWEDSPGEEAQSALERNSRVPGGWSGTWRRVGAGCSHPLCLADSSPQRGHSWRRTRWGLCGHSSCN